jgi:hypothetical protein
LVGALAENLGAGVEDQALLRSATAFREAGRLIERYREKVEGDAVGFTGGYTITVHKVGE